VSYPCSDRLLLQDTTAYRLWRFHYVANIVPTLTLYALNLRLRLPSIIMRRCSDGGGRSRVRGLPLQGTSHCRYIFHTAPQSSTIFASIQIDHTASEGHRQVGLDCGHLKGKPHRSASTPIYTSSSERHNLRLSGTFMFQCPNPLQRLYRYVRYSAPKEGSPLRLSAPLPDVGYTGLPTIRACWRRSLHRVGSHRIQIVYWKGQ
jgi:hypothetical protein